MEICLTLRRRSPPSALLPDGWEGHYSRRVIFTQPCLPSSKPFLQSLQTIDHEGGSSRVRASGYNSSNGIPRICAVRPSLTERRGAPQLNFLLLESHPFSSSSVHAYSLDKKNTYVPAKLLNILFNFLETIYNIWKAINPTKAQGPGGQVWDLILFWIWFKLLHRSNFEIRRRPFRFWGRKLESNSDLMTSMDRWIVCQFSLSCFVSFDVRLLHKKKSFGGSGFEVRTESPAERAGGQFNSFVEISTDFST